MTTTKKRNHRNNKARTTARERAGALLALFCVTTGTTLTLAQDLFLMKAATKSHASHAAATLDRKKRRGK